MHPHSDPPSMSDFPAVPMQYALARMDQAHWTDVYGSGLQARDLLLQAASSGQLSARGLRARAAGQAARWPMAPSSMTLLYVTSGELCLTLPERPPVVLRAGDCTYQDVLEGASQVSWSADFGGFDIAIPPLDKHATTFDTLRFPPGTVPTGVRLNAPDAFKADGGPRKFFVYRDLGAAAASGRRLHIHVVRAVGLMESGTGWHVHSMSQLFYVVTGWVDICVEGRPSVRMVPGEAMCLGKGMRHDVAGFSPDYTVFELCLPGDYSTVATPAP